MQQNGNVSLEALRQKYREPKNEVLAGAGRFRKKNQLLPFMTHALFEFSPFLAGLLAGVLAYFGTASHRPRAWLIVGTSVLIGGACALVAGELTHGFAAAALCLVWDSTMAAAGAVTAHLVLRRVMA